MIEDQSSGCSGRGVFAIAPDREVASASPPRGAGDILAGAVSEERVALVKRLFAVDPLCTRRTAVTDPVASPAAVRMMRAIVDRDDAAPATGETDHG